MRTRTKILATALIAGSALTAALPAQAQSYPQANRYEQNRHEQDRRDYNGYDRNYRGNANAIYQQIQQLRMRIQRTDARDRISEREAAGLRRAVNQLQQQFRDYNRNGLSQRETRILQDRINQIRARLSYERRDNDGRRW
ncbi:hypothetical protein ACFO0A_13225 [Novosphingobium tardum]|jgi:predicted RNase H-like nuclease (RuvC/YqgF family)|uniref:Uncharacterized protein n=1 Tax=Novosphingobium tardum TaxID=1538021 RepID=A0ABV8RRI0_9SPHN